MCVTNDRHRTGWSICHQNYSFSRMTLKKVPYFQHHCIRMYYVFSRCICKKSSKKVRSHTLAVIVNPWKVQILPKQWIGNEVWDQLQKSLVVHLGLGVLKLVSYLNAVSTLKNSLLFKENRQIELCPPVQSKACLLWIPCLGDKIHFAPFQERESRPAMAPSKKILWLLQRFQLRSQRDQDPSVGPKWGTRVWDLSMGAVCGTNVWDPCLGPICGPFVWDLNVGSVCGTRVWYAYVVVQPGAWM